MFQIKKFLFVFVGMYVCLSLNGQTGPNSPTAASNTVGIGANAWVNPNNIFSTNNAYSTVATKGLTNYLRGTNFGFAIPGPVNIDGIQVEIEKSTSAPASVSVLNTWSSGLTKTISAGTSRCLIVIIAMENNVVRDLTNLTYGGQAMTQIAEIAVGGGGGFSDRIEAWILLETGIAAAGSTALVATYGSGAGSEYAEAFSSAAFQNVDQLVPVSSLVTSSINAATDPHQLGTAITTLDGSVAINGVICGNNSTPAVAVGGTNTYTINSGYTEGTDIYFGNATTGTATGGCLQTAHKVIATAGTEQPTCNFNGTVNRHAMIGLTLQRAREIDNEVRIVQGGTITGSNFAATPFWTTTDAYTTYGGATSLWGATWVLADVNATNFGAAIAARVQNGTARVDHMRITVYTTSTLPIELLDFKAEAKNSYVDLKWITATETNNDYFIVQRSKDAIDFEDVLQVDGAGNSSGVLFYNMQDTNPFEGTSYYRLKQVDYDGNYTHSSIQVVDFSLSTNTVFVFPNPTQGDITIYNSHLSIDEVAIYSSDLKLIKYSALTQGVNPIINIEDFADGAYFLMIKTKQDTKVVKVLKTSRDKQN